MTKLYAKLMSVVFLLFLVVNTASCSTPAPKDDLDAMLPGILQGCKDNFANIRSGKGSLTVHRTINYIKDDAIKAVETKGAYDVVFDDTKYKCVGTSTVINNELYPSVIKPGSVERYSIVNDGEKVTLITDSVGTTGLITGKACPEKTSLELAMLLPRNKRTESGHGIGFIDYKDKPDSTILVGKGIHVTGTEDVDGHPCLVVEAIMEITLPDGRAATNTWKYWVDTNRSFCIPLIQVWSKDEKLEKPVLFVEFHTVLREYGPGIWGPARYTSLQNSYDAKQGLIPFVSFETTYAPDFQFNVPVSPAELVLKIPPGVSIRDVDGATP